MSASDFSIFVVTIPLTEGGVVSATVAAMSSLSAANTASLRAGKRGWAHDLRSIQVALIGTLTPADDANFDAVLSIGKDDDEPPLKTVINDAGIRILR